MENTLDGLTVVVDRLHHKKGSISCTSQQGGLCEETDTGCFTVTIPAKDWTSWASRRTLLTA